MWYFCSLLPGSSMFLVKANCPWLAWHWFKCCQLHFVAQPHSFPSIYSSVRARNAWNHCGETGNRGTPCSGGKGGIAQLRYQPGAGCCCPQVLNCGFLSGIPRSHAEGANWVRTRSISRSSRTLTTAKSWWRSRRFSSLLHCQGQGRVSRCLCPL